MLVSKQVKNSQLYKKHIKGNFVPIDHNKASHLTVYQIVSICQSSFDLSFLTIKNETMKSKYTTLGKHEMFDTITDACLISNDKGIDYIDGEESKCDYLAVGLRDSGIIALV